MNLQISPTDLAQRLRSATPPHLLDVREAEENTLVALPNSTLIPLGELAARAEEIADWRDEEIVVYCHHGIRSLNAIAQLKHFGFAKLQNLAGGIDRWSVEVDAELPRY
ncbi:MAG: rhodanese-like domain-containing protein [Verrucomicrobiota bacterium]